MSYYSFSLEFQLRLRAIITYCGLSLLCAIPVTVFSKMYLSSWMFFDANCNASPLLHIIHPEGLFSFYLHTISVWDMCCNMHHITHIWCVDALIPMTPIIAYIIFTIFLFLSYLCTLPLNLLKYKFLKNTNMSHSFVSSTNGSIIKLLHVKVTKSMFLEWMKEWTNMPSCGKYWGIVLSNYIEFLKMS